MSDGKHNRNIKLKVMELVESGEIQMKSRLQFWSLWILAFCATVFASLFLAYILNIAFFATRIFTAGTPAYGARDNLSKTIASFPWWTIAAFIICFALAWYFGKRYTLLYRLSNSILVMLFMAITMFMFILIRLFVIHP